jgi:hypothetical protein
MLNKSFEGHFILSYFLFLFIIKSTAKYRFEKLYTNQKERNKFFFVYIYIYIYYFFSFIKIKSYQRVLHFFIKTLTTLFNFILYQYQHRHRNANSKQLKSIAHNKSSNQFECNVIFVFTC